MTVVASVSDLAPGTAKSVTVDGTPVVLVRDEEGTFHALDEMCTHGNVSLADGEVYDCTIECWKHGAAFDLLTGKPTSLPATQPVRVHSVSVDGTDVLVALTN